MNDDDSTYYNLVNSLPEIVFELDGDGNLRYLNEFAVSILGYSMDEMIGKSPFIFIHPEDHVTVKPIFDRILKGEQFVRGDLTVVTRDGKTFPAAISINPIMTGGRVTRISGIVIDISKKKSVEEKLVKSEERLKRLSDMALEGIIIFEGGKITDANKAFCDMFGYTGEEIIGKELKELIFSDSGERTAPRSEQEDFGDIQFKGVRKNGELFDIEFTMRSLIQDNEKIYTAMVQDISHQKRIEYMEEHDELTDLLNKRGLIKKLKESIVTADAKKEKIAIITIRTEQDELSVIKNISPELEKVLINAVPLEIADRLRSKLFNADVMACIDKYEYMTLHPMPGDSDVSSSVTLINKILNVFSEEFVRGIRMIPHLGVTFYPDDLNSNNPAQIFSNSNYACEEAIKKRKDYAFYDEHSHLEMRERIEFDKDLIIAVREERCVNFILYYQPKVNNEGLIEGMEALVRWNHTRWNRGPESLVSPGKFIQRAEEIGLIGDIGQWVLMEACRQTKAWHEKNEKYRNLQVAVNVSPSQLNDDFVYYVEHVLKTTGLSPRCLELEITERESVKRKNLEILYRLKSRDVSIAIDDFGVDYSSLNMLPKLSINTIKLDKSYIDNVASDLDYENLVYYTIKMVHGFNYKVVAEGVEEADQVQKLFYEMGCDRIQGFYFFKPLSAGDFERILESNLAV